MIELIGFSTWPAGDRPDTTMIRTALNAVERPALIVFPEAASEACGYHAWHSWRQEPTPWIDFLMEVAEQSNHSFVTGTIEMIDGVPRNCSRLIGKGLSKLLHIKTVDDLPEDAFVAAESGLLCDRNPTIHRGISIASLLCVEYNEPVWIELQQRLAEADQTHAPVVIAIPSCLSRDIVNTRSPLTWPLLNHPVVLANSHPKGLESFVADRQGTWIRRADATRLVIEVASLKEAMP